jgi:Predicted xylanase/chitin deacetylase
MKKRILLLSMIVTLLLTSINLPAFAAAPKSVTIPRIYGIPKDEAVEIFTAAGLTCEFTYANHHTAKDSVYSVQFYGKYDDDNYYITPGTTVTLRVSLGMFAPKQAVAPSDKTIYLTFDDGPSSVNTDKILEILKSYEIKATFFLVGTQMQYLPKQVKSVYDAGHALGCHSTTHRYADIYASKDAFLADIRTWEKTAADILGKDAIARNLYRFPGGSHQARGNPATYNNILMALDENKYSAFDWTMTNEDVYSRTRSGSAGPLEYVKNQFLTQLDRFEKSGSKSPKILLLHETYDCTTEMLTWAIDLLVERGYTFDTLDNLDGNWFM